MKRLPTITLDNLPIYMGVISGGIALFMSRFSSGSWLVGVTTGLISMVLGYAVVRVGVSYSRNGKV